MNTERRNYSRVSTDDDKKEFLKYVWVRIKAILS